MNEAIVGILTTAIIIVFERMTISFSTVEVAATNMIFKVQI